MLDLFEVIGEFVLIFRVKDDFVGGDGGREIVVEKTIVDESISEILDFEVEGEIGEKGLKPVDDDGFGGQGGGIVFII